MDESHLRQKLLTIIESRFGFGSKLPYTLDDLVSLDIDELTKIATMDESDIELY